MMLTGLMLTEDLLDLKLSPPQFSFHTFAEPRFMARDGCSDLESGLCI